MSRSDRVIRVSRDRAPTNNIHRVTSEHAETTKQPEVFTEMQRNMEDELEQRRHDWEKEVEKMQLDFFQLKAGDKTKSITSGSENTSSPGQGDRAVAIASSVNPLKPVGPSRKDIFDISDRKNLYTEMPDGSKQFKMRFDVRGFDPEEISVRADGARLTVSAQTEEEYGGKNKNTRQYNRQADIPEDVDPDAITSALSSDGILSVEAPVMEGVTPRTSAGAIEYEHEHEHNNEPLLVGGGTGAVHSQMIDFDRPHQFLDSPHEYHRVLESYSGGGGRTSIGEAPRTQRFHNEVHDHPPKARVVTRVHEYGSPRSAGLRGFTDAHAHNVLTDGCKVITPSKYRTAVNNNNNTSSSYSSGGGGTRSNEPNVMETEHGPMLKIEVNIGEYAPEDVSISLSDRKVSVKAKKEETIRGRSSRREFSREFDIPEPIQRRYFKAKLCNDGRLVFGGSFASNKDHEQVLQRLYNSMPIYGTNIQVE